WRRSEDLPRPRHRTRRSPCTQRCTRTSCAERSCRASDRMLHTELLLVEVDRALPCLQGSQVHQVVPLGEKREPITVPDQPEPELSHLRLGVDLCPEPWL